MYLNKKHAEWLTAVLFLCVVALVFQQIATDMTDQGIASGGPYDNAAAYPQIIAIVLGVLTLAQAGVQLLAPDDPSDEKTGATPRQLMRPAALVIIFAAYLGALGYVGYHIATPVMLAVLMMLCGIRRPLAIVVPAVLISVAFAYVFEAWLKIVLPGGFLNLNIAW